MNRLFLLLFGMVTFVAHAQIPSYAPTEGLVAWYPLDGNGSNSVVSEFPDLEFIGNEVFHIDRYGNESSAYNPDGSRAVTSGYNWPFDYDSSFTLSVWVWKTDGASGNGRLISTECPEGNFRINNWSPTNGLVVANGYPFFLDPVPQSEWFHLIFNYENDVIRVYLDGELAIHHELAYLENLNLCSPLTIGAKAAPAFDSWPGYIDDIGIWNRVLNEEEILALYNAELPTPGCTDTTACNFDAEATSDDGSCIPSGCMEPLACNYNVLAECAGEACDYTCCPGPGCCSAGMYWDYDVEQCMNYETCQDDLDGDGVIGVNDLMQLLSSFGTDCVQAEDPESTEFTCGDPVSYQGYDYETVQIGEQCWFAENLRAENYRNGEQIASHDYSTNALEFGVLYRGAVLIADQNVCPAGWSVTSDNDWLELELFLGAESSEVQLFEYSDERLLGFGDELKLSSSNQLGFNAAFGGYLNGPDAIEATDLGVNGQWWTSTFSEDDGNLAIYRNLESWTSGISRIYQPISYYGFSIRCLKD